MHVPASKKRGREDRDEYRNKRQEKEYRKEGRQERSRVLFVGNLSYDTDELALEDLFREIGKISDVRIAETREGASKGFAHVEFKYAEDVDKAIQKLDGTSIDGRRIRLDCADPESTSDYVEEYNHKKQKRRDSGSFRGGSGFYDKW